MEIERDWNIQMMIVLLVIALMITLVIFAVVDAVGRQRDESDDYHRRYGRWFTSEDGAFRYTQSFVRLNASDPGPPDPYPSGVTIKKE